MTLMFVWAAGGTRGVFTERSPAPSRAASWLKFNTVG
jgi:hypothetical protein